MMVGIQATGKSTVAREWLAKAGYVVLSNDALGHGQKQKEMLKALRYNIEQKNSCVIDNTHVNVETRKKVLGRNIKLVYL